MKIFSIIIVSLSLSGCGLFGAKIEDNRPPPVLITNKTLIAYSCPPPPQLDTFNGRRIDWDVISRKEFDEKLVVLMNELGVEEGSIEEENFFIVNQMVGDFFFGPGEDGIWALNADDYADFGKNTSDVLAATKQMKDVIRHFKKCIADSEKAVLEINRTETE